MKDLFLTEKLEGKETGNIYIVDKISLIHEDGSPGYDCNVEHLMSDYIPYVDPKDAEIARLKAIIDEMRKPVERKTRRRLLPEEWKEVKELIRKGISNTDIAAEYDISDSAVSKKRIEMRSMGEKV